jgi:hypothetical protein
MVAVQSGTYSRISTGSSGPFVSALALKMGILYGSALLSGSPLRSLPWFPDSTIRECLLDTLSRVLFESAREARVRKIQ